MRWLIVFAALGIFALGSYVRAAASQPPAPLTVALSVPAGAEGSDISNPNFHFVVTITDTSTYPVSILKRIGSDGCVSVLFYVDSIDGRRVMPPKQLSGCEQFSWSNTAIEQMTLRPGQIVVRNYYLGHPNSLSALLLPTVGQRGYNPGEYAGCLPKFSTGQKRMLGMFVTLIVPPTLCLKDQNYYIVRQYGPVPKMVNSPEVTFTLTSSIADAGDLTIDMTPEGVRDQDSISN